MQKTILNLTNIFYNLPVVRLFRRKTNMKKVWKRGAAFALAASVACSKNVMSLVYSADKNSDSVEWNTDAEVSVEYLTLQPGETDSAVNLNWYAPTGTEKAIVKFGDRIVEASVEELHTPTKVDQNKYTDTGKMVCKATVDGLTKDTEYQYQVSYDDGKTWSEINSYKTAKENEFKFGFTSDPQIKENGESNKEGWNSSDGTNQTGWATMLDKLMQENVNLVVSAGDQVEDQSWGKSSEYAAFFAPKEMSSILYAPAVGNHDRHYMFADHFNLPNEMLVDGSEGVLSQVKTTFRGQNSGTSQSHGNYIQATADEIANQSESNGVTPNAEGQYDFTERREMETKGNYYYLYDNVLFVTLNTGAYPGGNDAENADNADVPSASKDNSEAEAIVKNFKTTLSAATAEYAGQYQWLIVTHHKSTQTVAKHAADSDIENYVDGGFEKVMDEFDVDFVLGGHDHVYSRSYVLKDGQRNSERLDTINDPDGTIYLTGNCCSDMQYYTPFEKLDKNNNADFPILANGESGSASYLEGNLPVGNQEWNQEYSPSYAIFDVTDQKISVNVYNLSGESDAPDSELIDSFSVTKNTDGGEQTSGKENTKTSLDVVQKARYDSGMTNADGGVMEIVDYNTTTGWAYAVNGVTGNLTAIAIKDMKSSEKIDLLDGNDIDVKSMVEENCAGFVYGDMTSVAVSEDGSKLAVAIQAENYADTGRVALFTCNADGTLTFDKVYETGVQPDMVTFASNDSKILTADEGEPRDGYGDGIIDPKGTVTIINLADQTVSQVDFTSYDNSDSREQLVESGVILKKNTNPSVDFEPEYIAVGDKTAYVTLQEANAIAVIDLNQQSLTGVYSAGYEDYSTCAVDIDKKDEAYKPAVYETLRGIRMPDGIATYHINGVDYIVTANEGDSREWGEYLNEDERNFGKGETSPTGKITAENSGLTGKVVFFDSSDYDGLDSEFDYLFGGRSFTVFKADEQGLTEIYTSGNEFEAKTAGYELEHFNCSNDNNDIDDRSGKKGVEAENVTIGNVGEKIYAFIGLERIGGVMMYDVTNPEKISYANYINSRDFSADIAGDDSPEGLCFISESESVDGNAHLLTACEVSGTVASYELTARKTEDQGNEQDSDNGQDSGEGQNSNNGQESGQGAKSDAPKTGDMQKTAGLFTAIILTLTVVFGITKRRRYTL